MYDGMTIHRLAHLCLSGQWELTEQSALTWAQLFQRPGFVNHFFCRKNTPLHQELQISQISHQAISPLPLMNFLTKKEITKSLTENQSRFLFLHSLKDIWQVPLDIKRTQKLKIIGFEHQFIKDSSRLLKIPNPILQKLFSQLDLVITTSQLQRSQLADQLPIRDDRLKVLYPPVDCSEFNIREPSRELRARLGVSAPDQVVLGWMGAMKQSEGPEEFIEAAFQIKRAVPNVRFVMVEFGDDSITTDLKIELKRQIDGFGLSREFLICSFQKLNIKYAHLLNLFDIYCYTAYEEPFSQMLLEALASGLAIIATNNGSIPELIEDGRNGLLVLPKNSGALAQAALQIINNPNFNAQIKREARLKAMDKFESNLVLDQLVQLLTGSSNDYNP